MKKEITFPAKIGVLASVVAPGRALARPRTLTRRGERPAPQPAGKFYVPVWAVVPVLLMLLVFSTVVTYEQVYSQRIASGVTVQGIQLGSLEPAAAHRLVSKSLQTYLNRPLVFSLNTPLPPKAGDENGAQATGLQWQATPAELGFKFDTEATVQRALQVGREGSGLSQLGDQWNARWGGRSVAPAFTFDDAALQAAFDGLALEVNRPITNAGMRIENGQITILPSAIGIRLDRYALASEIANRVTNLSAEPIKLPMLTVTPTLTETELNQVKAEAQRMMASPVTLNFEDRNWTVEPSRIASMIGVFEEKYADGTPAVKPRIDPEAAMAYAKTLSKEINRDPIDGRFQIDDGKVTVLQPSVNGVSVATEKLAGILTRAAEGVSPQERAGAVPVSVEKPKISMDEINTAFTYRIESRTLAYTYSMPSRAHNIELGASVIHGYVVAPGETFSFNALVGDTTPDKGYGIGYAINGYDPKTKKAKYVLDYGGGICQVATTLFQSVFFSGYEIVDRTNHANRITAYEPIREVQGVDATVYYPIVDFKWRNNSDYPVLIDIRAGGGRVTSNLYTTDPGWKVQVNGPFGGGTALRSERIVTDRQGNSRVFTLFSNFVGIE